MKDEFLIKLLYSIYVILSIGNSSKKKLLTRILIKLWFIFLISKFFIICSEKQPY